MNFKKFSVLFLVVICIITALLVLLTINYNIDNPNLIVYFNVDEGYLMDLIWFYFTGEKRVSFQMTLDYGLEMVYLSDLSRIIFSKFINFTPGTFVLILRWFHLVAWIGALIALWRLVGYHFGKGWQQALAVLLLAVRPALDYFSNSIKPEPVVLFFIIIGLDYALRIVEKPIMKHLLISISCASAAFVTKFAGIFLLPAIIAAMYFGNRHRTAFNKNHSTVNFKVKNSWPFPLLISLSLMAAPFVAIFLYVRKTTGLTYYEEFGFWQSVLKNEIIIFLWFVATVFLILSFMIFIFNRSKNYFISKVIRKIDEINSYAIIVTGLFLGFVFLFGFRWFTIPSHFLDIYVAHVHKFGGGIELGNIHTVADFFNAFQKSIIYKIISFDILMLLLFGIYLIMEFPLRAQNLNSDKLRLYKRLTLLIFLAPFFLSLFSIGRFASHHMLPFFVAMLILVIQGIRIFIYSFNGRKLHKYIAIGLTSILLIADVGLNASNLIELRLHRFNQKEDIAFALEKWWQENIPKDTSIVADHHSRVYILPEYKNIKIFKGFQKDRVEQLRYLVNTYHPQLIYYNAGPCGDIPLPSLEEMLPDKKVRLLKTFDSDRWHYQRTPGDKFVIYEVLY